MKPKFFEDWFREDGVYRAIRKAVAGTNRENGAYLTVREVRIGEWSWEVHWIKSDKRDAGTAPDLPSAKACAIAVYSLGETE